jgi:hypothetical protein
MFNQAWKKYLPVITILIKRSSIGEQTLKMNHTDFERAAGGRKIKWSFPTLQLSNGRFQNTSKQLPLALEMVAAMQADELIIELLKKKDFEFSMTNDFQLTIKNTTMAPEAVSEEITEELID